MKRSLTSENTRVACAVYRNSVQRIQRAVCEHYSISLEDVQKHTRKGSSIKARQKVHYLCKEIVPNCSLSIVGILTGNGKPFDHSSVLHSCKVVKRDLNNRSKLTGELVYPEVKSDLDEIRKIINSPGKKKRMKFHYRNLFKKATWKTLKHTPVSG